MDLWKQCVTKCWMTDLLLDRSKRTSQHRRVIHAPPRSGWLNSYFLHEDVNETKTRSKELVGLLDSQKKSGFVPVDPIWCQSSVLLRWVSVQARIPHLTRKIGDQKCFLSFSSGILSIKFPETPTVKAACLFFVSRDTPASLANTHRTEDLFCRFTNRASSWAAAKTHQPLAMCCRAMGRSWQRRCYR